MIFDNNKTNVKILSNHMNALHQHLEFKPPGEDNGTINYFDLTTTRNNNNFNLEVYRKPTHTDTTIHFTSNHIKEHKLAAYRPMIH